MTERSWAINGRNEFTIDQFGKTIPSERNLSRITVPQGPSGLV